MNEEEINDIQTLEVDINNIDDLALGLEICSKKSNMVIQEFANMIINLQQENKQLKERIDKAIEYINEATNYPRGCGLEPLDEIYAENIIDRLKGDSNE